MTLALLALLALAIGVNAWASVEAGRERTRQLQLQLEDVRELRQEARTLVEAVTRRSETPVIFRAPEPRPSEGWLDAPAELRVRGE